MKEIQFTARELIDKLKELNGQLYEEVLDTISDHYNSIISYDGYFAWGDGDNGNMLMYIEGENNV